MLSTEILNWLLKNKYGDVSRIELISNGNSAVQRLHLSSGRTIFLKQYPFSPPEVILAEVKGLKALKKTKTIYVPEPYHWGEKFLLLEDIAGKKPKLNFEEIFGRQLATMHLNINSRFGFNENNFIGASPQINTWEENGHTFYKKHRLGKQLELIKQKDYFNQQDYLRYAQVLNHLEKFIPEQPASIIHGDLWNGNVLVNYEGDPAIIDPAVHYGWAEAELAMTAMFGGFGDTFYAAYQEVRLLASGWQNRFPLYNLYHYMNHLLLFGSSYLNSVRSILRKFS